MHTPPSPALGDMFYKQVGPLPLGRGIMELPGSPGRPGLGAPGLVGTQGVLSTGVCFSESCLFSLGDAIQKGPCRPEAKGRTLAVPTWLGQQWTPGEKAVPGFGVVLHTGGQMTLKPLALWVRVTQKREGPRAARGGGFSHR